MLYHSMGKDLSTKITTVDSGRSCSKRQFSQIATFEFNEVWCVTFALQNVEII